MTNCFDYRCPRCGSTDQLDVAARVWVRLTDDGTDADASENGRHEWNDESPAMCGSCQFTGTVADFDPKGAAA